MFYAASIGSDHSNRDSQFHFDSSNTSPKLRFHMFKCTLSFFFSISLEENGCSELSIFLSLLNNVLFFNIFDSLFPSLSAVFRPWCLFLWLKVRNLRAWKMKVDVHARRPNGGRKWNLIYFINFVETFKKGNHQVWEKEEIEIRASSLDFMTDSYLLIRIEI